MIFGCKCPDCGEWHSHIKDLGDGKFKCINCYYNLKRGKLNGEDKNKRRS